MTSNNVNVNLLQWNDSNGRVNVAGKIWGLVEIG